MTTYFPSLPSEIPIPVIPEELRWENSAKFKAAIAKGESEMDATHIGAKVRHDECMGDPTIIGFLDLLYAQKYSEAKALIDSEEVKLNEYLVNGKTVLHLAFRGNYWPMKFLLSCGANPNISEYEEFDKDNVEFAGQLSDFGKTVLGRAAETGKHQLIGLFLAFGADPNKRWNGLTPYQCCLDGRDGDAGNQLRKWQALGGRQEGPINFDRSVAMLLPYMEQALLEEVVIAGSVLPQGKSKSV